LLGHAYGVAMPATVNGGPKRVAEGP